MSQYNDVFSPNRSNFLQIVEQIISYWIYKNISSTDINRNRLELQLLSGYKLSRRKTKQEILRQNMFISELNYTNSKY